MFYVKSNFSTSTSFKDNVFSFCHWFCSITRTNQQKCLFKSLQHHNRIQYKSEKRTYHCHLLQVDVLLKPKAIAIVREKLEESLLKKLKSLEYILKSELENL